MPRWLILTGTHILVMSIGFAGGIYLLPILIAPDDPPVAQVQAAMKDAPRNRGALASGQCGRFKA